MGKIHWSVYIIIGVAVLVSSYRIDAKKFTLFIWVGYLFLIIGVAKLGIWFVSRGKESSVEKRAVERDDYRQKPVQRGYANYCAKCGSSLHGFKNFCSKCGNRVQLR